MSSLWPDALKSLNDSVAPLSENLAKLAAAKPVDIEEIIAQVKAANESARAVRERLSSELPEASWASCEELEALIDEAQRSFLAKTTEQRRARLLAVAKELERGTIVHRRAHRLEELNQLRDQAVNELQSLAALGEVIHDLPGPQAAQWIEWACGLKEPQDAESLEVLRSGFAHLDNFVANLEASMWLAGVSSPLELEKEAEKSTDTATEKQLPMEPNESGSSARFPDVLNEEALRELVANARVPHSASPAQSEEERQRTQAREQALLASMMGCENASLPQSNVVSPVISEAFRQTDTESPNNSDTANGDKKLRRKKWWLLASVAVLAFAALGAVQLTSHRNRSVTASIESVEAKGADPAGSNRADQSYRQATLSTVPTPVASEPVMQSQERPKPQAQSVIPGPLTKGSPSLRPQELKAAALQPPAETPNKIAMAKKEEEDPPNGTGGVLGSIPGGMPNEIPNSAANVVTNVPVAMPLKVSSGVAQGMLIHQVTPQYPPLALEARVQGTVVFQAVIAKDGSVQDLHTLSGHPMLVKAAADAVRKWRYKPFYLNGEPVEANTQISVRFNPDK